MSQGCGPRRNNCQSRKYMISKAPGIDDRPGKRNFSAGGANWNLLDSSAPAPEAPRAEIASSKGAVKFLKVCLRITFEVIR